jgi:hypothetical protein
VPTSHADLIPTLLGLAGIDRDGALATLTTDHKETRPLIGRDLSEAIRAAEATAPSEPILFTTDDEISEGNEAPASPFQKAARLLHRSGTIKQPNRLETVIAEVDVDGERHPTTTTSSSGPCPASVTSASTRAKRSPSPSLNPTSTSSMT